MLWSGPPKLKLRLECIETKLACFSVTLNIVFIKFPKIVQKLFSQIDCCSITNKRPLMFEVIVVTLHCKSEVTEYFSA